MLKRRDFIMQNLAGLGVVPLTASVPLFITRSLSAADRQTDGRILVVVELDGGNDGINTVVPYADEGYARHRKSLRLPTDKLFRLDDHVGLHPALGGMAELWEAGRLNIVQGVGYPNPSRSHFQSMAIWHSARIDAQARTGLGWLGRGLDEARPQPRVPVAMNVGPQSVPTALRGRRAGASSVYRLEQFHVANDSDLLTPSQPDGMPPQDALQQFVYRTSSDAAQAVQQLKEVGHVDMAAEQYPKSELANHLQLTARLIRADLGIRAFYTQQSGYDTHAGQLPQHERLLREFGGALQAFFRDLDAAGLADRVLVLAFSEFGRRVEENASLGTDHGTAGPVFLAGPAVQGGLTGKTPRLTDLQQGDLKTSVDFRRVYATILDQWLGIASPAALGGNFAALPLLSAKT